MRTHLSLLLLIFVSFSPICQGSLLVEYPFTQGIADQHPANTLSGLTASDFGRTPNTLNIGASGAYSSSWPIAFDNTEYYEFNLAINQNLTARIDGVDFSLRSTATGPGKVDLYYSTNNFSSSTLISSITQPRDSNIYDYNITAIGISASGETTLTFRFFGYDATAAAGTLRIEKDSLKIYGSIGPTPPVTTAPLSPGALVIMLIGIILVGWWGIRKTQRHPIS